MRQPSQMENGQQVVFRLSCFPHQSYWSLAVCKGTASTLPTPLVAILPCKNSICLDKNNEKPLLPPTLGSCYFRFFMCFKMLFISKPLLNPKRMSLFCFSYSEFPFIVFHFACNRSCSESFNSSSV